MPGIAQDNVEAFQKRVARFSTSYVNDWNQWLATPDEDRASIFGGILRRWQACRPNRMRRTRYEAAHNEPFLEDLIAQANPHISILDSFDIAHLETFTAEVRASLDECWRIFQDLAYQGRVRSGLTGVVGISKATLLLSRGRVGPAFDSKVRGQLGIGRVDSAEKWIEALEIASLDIQRFEQANATTLRACVPSQAHLQTARIYDMALGPD